MNVSRDDLVQAGAAYVALVQALEDDAIDTAQGLEAWALSWGARIMDTLEALQREQDSRPGDGGRDIVRLWLDKAGLLQCAIDVPKESDAQEGGIEDEAHFAALYTQLLTAQKLIGQLIDRMRGTTGVQ